MTRALEAARDAPKPGRIADPHRAELDETTSSDRRYARRMRDLGWPADYSVESIERYRQAEIERRRSASFVDNDVLALRRRAELLIATTPPTIYEESLRHLGIDKRFHGAIRRDLQALMRRVGSMEPQCVLSIENIKAEIASGPPVRYAGITIVERRHIVRLLRHDLVAFKRSYDVGTMTTPAHLKPQLDAFLRNRPGDRLRRRWKAYLVFLDSREESFSVSDDLFDAFRTWLRQRRWQEKSIEDILVELRDSIRKADRHDAFGPKNYRYYHESETSLTEPMMSVVKELRARVSRGEFFPVKSGPEQIRNTLIDFCKVCRVAGQDPQVTVRTMDVYLESLSRRGARKHKVVEALTAIRRYCECSGEGAAWCRMDEYTGDHHANAPVLMPEPVRRKFDLFVKHASLGRFYFPKNKVRKLELFLGKYFCFCRATGRPEDLSEATIAAYFASLRRTVATKTRFYMQSKMRLFLRECYPRNPWLFSGHSLEWRMPHEIIDQKHWDRLRGRALIALENGIDASAIRSLDPILAYASMHQTVSPARILGFAGSNRQKLNAIIRAMLVIDPESSLLFPLRSAIDHIPRKLTNFDAGADKIALAYEVLLAKCPDPLRGKLIPMTVLDRRGNRELPVHAVRSLSSMARQLVVVAKEKGLEPFTAGAYTALIVKFAASSLRAITISNYLAQMSRIAVLLELPDEVLDEVRQYGSRFKARAREEGTLKAARLLSQPLSIEDMAMAAGKARQDAFDTSRSETRMRRSREAAAAIAIWTALPLRIVEMQMLVLGITLIRRENAWHVSLATSKSKTIVDRILPHQVTPHIDLLVMHGSRSVVEAQVHAAYIAQEGLPLFRSRHGTPLSHQTFERYLSRYIPATPHIFRTLVRDRMAILGASGDEISRHQLSHRSKVSGRHYEVFANSIRAAEADRLLYQGALDADADRP